DPARANEQLANIRRVTIADLERVARKYLVPQRQIVVKIPMSGGPGGSKNPEEDAPITAKPETKAPPAGRPGVKRPESYFPTAPLAGPLDLQAPSFAHTTHTLTNGLKVLVIPNHETTLVSMQLGLLAGAWTETKPGSASMALDMITKGTKQHNEAELADELGTYAISLGGSGVMDSASVNANCLTEQLDRTIGLLGEVVLTPTFPKDEYIGLKEQTLSGLLVSTSDPTYQAQLALRRAVYGEHPYARSAAGEPADVEALSLDDLTAWWKQFARPDMAVLIFAGDIEDARAVELAKKTFGGWKAAGPKPEVKLPAPPPSTTTRIILVDKTRSTQSQIRVGQLGITRHDPKYFFSRVVDTYFGGSFSSRLNTAIRVNKGLTYGANGGFHAQRFAGSFSVSTFSKTESTVEALEAVLAEIKRLKAEPPTTEELRKTKAYLVGNFPLERETPFQMASELWLIETNSLPAGYFEQELQAVATTGEPECMKLISDVVNLDKMTIVVVGKAEAIKAGLEKVAPVTVVQEEAEKGKQRE
ncbi:MAG TPA: pitrilysin family protein, partial [Pirellulales bacterium]